jgi:2-amino-1-hydroxyethylphosphonate dioxygenase (glycine-forming)
MTKALNKTVEISANEIIFLYEKFGNANYIGEPVSQIEHMVQCAQLAQAAHAADDVVLAAFLHDIGHLCAFAFPQQKLDTMDEYGIVDHEKLGANYLLSKGFSKKIAQLVQSHVAAKRYLTYAFPQYFNQLSDASKKTLQQQGGVMAKEEAEEFEKDPLFEQYIALRKWDEQAKKIQQPLPNLQEYKDLIIEHLALQNS